MSEFDPNIVRFRLVRHILGEPVPDQPLLTSTYYYPSGTGWTLAGNTIDPPFTSQQQEVYDRLMNGETEVVITRPPLDLTGTN